MEDKMWVEKIQGPRVCGGQNKPGCGIIDNNPPNVPPLSLPSNVEKSLPIWVIRRRNRDLNSGVSPVQHSTHQIFYTTTKSWTHKHSSLKWGERERWTERTTTTANTTVCRSHWPVPLPITVSWRYPLHAWSLVYTLSERPIVLIFFLVLLFLLIIF